MRTTGATLTLRVLPGAFAVCRFGPNEPLSVLPSASDVLWSITRTADELSLVCAESDAPPGATLEGGWRALRVVGTLDFALIGVLASLTAPLAAAGVSVFALSTFDTDYLLVKADRLSAAVDALRASGHSVEEVP